MTTTFLYKSDPVRGQRWAEVFRQHAPDIDFRIWPDIGDPLRVRFLAAWEPPARPWSGWWIAHAAIEITRRTICCGSPNNSSPLRSPPAKQHQALVRSAYS